MCSYYPSVPKVKILPTTQSNVQPCAHAPGLSPIQQVHGALILAPSQLCTPFTHGLCAHSNLKSAGALWRHTKTGKVNNTEKYICGTLKIPYYDNATGSKMFTKCGWFSPKEEFGESHSSV